MLVKTAPSFGLRIKYYTVDGANVAFYWLRVVWDLGFDAQMTSRVEERNPFNTD